MRIFTVPSIWAACPAKPVSPGTIFTGCSAAGIHFKSEPKEQFYGTEALIIDGVGNWFSMTQPK